MYCCRWPVTAAVALVSPPGTLAVAAAFTSGAIGQPPRLTVLVTGSPKLDQLGHTPGTVKDCSAPSRLNVTYITWQELMKLPGATEAHSGSSAAAIAEK